MKTIDEPMNPQPEGRLFAVIMWIGVCLVGLAITLGTIWCIACGITKIVEIFIK